jgi:ferredoxin-nitrite reductase
MEALRKAFEARNKKYNKIEKIKALKDPMEVYARLEQIAQGGYAALQEEDRTYFLKCFGLFDKGEDFMLRVRIPGGRLTYEQAMRLGETARTYGEDYIDLTTRMQTELRHIKIEHIHTVLTALKEAGISTFQTGVDNPRNILTDPLDGSAYDNLIACAPIVEKMNDAVIERSEWISALPRKFNTAILGSLSNSCNIYGHDCCFALANKDGELGFNLYLGARVGVQARDANLFVHPDEVVSCFLAILKVFKDYGYRDNRNKNRLHFLLQDVGIDNFVAAVKETAGKNFSSGGVTLVQSRPVASGANKVRLKDGTYAYKIIVPAGVFSGSDMQLAAQAALEYGNGEIRLSYDQNLYIVGIDERRLDAFMQSDIVRKYASYDDVYLNDMIACAGTHTCSFGVIPNKPDAVETAEFLRNEVPLQGACVRMNWSACPKGCGVHGIADIGFEGCKAKNDAGERVDGVHIFLGGKITRNAKEAHTLHKSLPLQEAKHHVKYLLKAYAAFKERTETFEAFESRFLSANYSYQALAFYTKINYVLNEKLQLDVMLELEKEPKTSKREEYELFNFGLRLFKLLTGQKRFEAVDGLHPTLVRPRKIKRDEVTRLNPAVPAKLSEIIYMMTHEDKKQRAQVFSELLVMLKEVGKN